MKLVHGTDAKKIYTGMHFTGHDFSDQDLQYADFQMTKLIGCNFDCANLSYANFEGANCYRSSFRQTSCYHTNFKDATLAETIFDPRDMFGMTVSLTCDIMDKTKLGAAPLAAFLCYPLQSDLGEKARNELEGVLTRLFGTERVKTLKKMFAARDL